jgi:hypothetical protein
MRRPVHPPFGKAASVGRKRFLLRREGFESALSELKGKTRSVQVDQVLARLQGKGAPEKSKGKKRGKPEEKEVVARVEPEFGDILAGVLFLPLYRAQPPRPGPVRLAAQAFQEGTQG